MSKKKNIARGFEILKKVGIKSRELIYYFYDLHGKQWSRDRGEGFMCGNNLGNVHFEGIKRLAVAAGTDMEGKRERLSQGVGKTSASMFFFFF